MPGSPALSTVTPRPPGPEPCVPLLGVSASPDTLHSGFLHRLGSDDDLLMKEAPSLDPLLAAAVLGVQCSASGRPWPRGGWPHATGSASSDRQFLEPLPPQDPLASSGLAARPPLPSVAPDARSTRARPAWPPLAPQPHAAALLCACDREHPKPHSCTPTWHLLACPLTGKGFPCAARRPAPVKSAVHAADIPEAHLYEVLLEARRGTGHATRPFPGSLPPSPGDKRCTVVSGPQ